MSQEKDYIAKLCEEERMDEVLLALENLERVRPLYPSELVLRGRAIQLGTGAVVSDYRKAEDAFRAALEIDPDYVPALTELGWFHYAPEDDAATALPFFEKAIEVSLGQLNEALRGKAGCLEELESSGVVGDFLQQISRQVLKLEDLEDTEIEENGAGVQS